MQTFTPYKALTRIHAIFAFAFIAVLSFCACSNSEGVDYPGWENASIDNGNNNEDDDVIVEPEKPSCFNSFRLPDLQSIACKKQFYSNDTVKDFPQSGFFQKTFTITFPDNKPLYCEIGGKPATKESPLVSTIQVDSSMAIRCADFSGKSASTEIIRTYILEKNPDIAAVFLTTDPNSLFNPDTGIYMEGANAEEAMPHYGANYWLDKEIPVFVELIENEQNKPAFAKYAGLKIFGNYSRVHPKKSVAITFREKYGDKRLYYPLFPEFPELTVFKSFILRNFGTSFGKDYIRDRLVSSISKGLDVDYQRGRYAIVYYNGRYFGLHDLRERSNEYYFETHYGINHSNINLIKTDNSTSTDSSSEFASIINWLQENDLNSEASYNYISSHIDLNNLVNYMIIETFANNRDWPGNNQKKWKCKNPSTLWKWFLYDMDLSFGAGNSKTENVFEYIFSGKQEFWQNAPNQTFFFRKLLENQKIKNKFINTMLVLLQTDFNRAPIISIIEKMEAEYKSEQSRDQKRWTFNVSEMTNQINIIRNFAQERQEIITNQLQTYFKLDKTSPLTIFITGNGIVHIDKFPVNESHITVDFFEDIPVTISAQPLTGSTWSHWSDGDTSTTKSIWPGKIKEIHAIFK